MRPKKFCAGERVDVLCELGIRTGKVLPRHSGEIEREPKPGGFDRKWSVPPAVRPTRDQLGNYLVRIEGEDARGLVVLAHESEMFTASASASATTTAPSTT